jgi:hypothetical protein
MSNQNLSNNTSARERIESRVNPANTAALTIGAGGAMQFSNMTDIMEFAKLMSVSTVAVPKHLRENPGACLAIVIQASEWQMSPYAVANKSYSVNDRLAYEAQLVAAVILRRAPIKSRFKTEYSGEAEKRKCKVSVTTLDGEVVFYESPPFGLITPKNSPLWKADPDQQLYYFSSRALCRRHFPDVLLGVYTMDELQDEPQESRKAKGRVVSDNPLASQAGQHIEAMPESEPMNGADEEPSKEDAASDAHEENADEAPFVSEEDERAKLIAEVKQMLSEENSTLNKFGEACRKQNVLSGTTTLRDVAIQTLRVIHDNRLAILRNEFGGEAQA